MRRFRGNCRDPCIHASHSIPVDVPDAILADLAVRLERTRLAEEVDAGDWGRGTHRGYLASLVRSWRHEFDWRAQEAALNELPHRRVHVDGLGIHVLHVRGRGPAPLPLLLTHGYPDSFVVPSLPGYGFSDPPRTTGTTFRIGELWHTLMSGHFAALEEPDLLAADLREFFRPLRPAAPATEGR